MVSDEDKYGTTEQQVKTGLEGAAKGVLGPLAPLIETKMLGVKPEDILHRQEANPITHGVSEAAGFAGSLFTGVGEAALAAKVGAKTLEAVGLGAKALEGAGLLTKIGAEGLNQATQMALLQGGDEISKRIINDPSATAENAIANIGLSTALGGVTGASIGALSPLFKAGAVKFGKVANEFVDEAKWATANKDPLTKGAEELTGLVNDTQALKESLYKSGLKGDLVKEFIPEALPKNIAKVDEQMLKVSDLMSDTVSDMSKSAKVGRGAAHLNEDLMKFNSVIKSPEASLLEKRAAMDDLRSSLHEYTDWKRLGTTEGTEVSKYARNINDKLIPMLEDSDVWGKAGKVQQVFNEAYSTFSKSKAEADFLKTFTNKVGDERVINPAKIETFVKQAGSPKAEIKNQILENYVKEHQAFADKINGISGELGKDALVPHNDMAVLNKLIGNKTEGSKLFQLLASKVGDEALGKTIAAGAGGAIGGGWGALLGEHLAGPTISKALNGLTAKLIENPRSIGGLKSAIDFTTAAIKGETTLNKAITSVFKGGSVAAAANFNKPSAEDREKLNKIVTKAQINPDMITDVNHGQISHYLPQHQAALSETNARSVQYLASLKPHPFRSSPLDKEIEPSDMEKARYNRALDIAQKPMIVLEHIKSGQLQATDVQDLQNMYPSFYKQTVEKLSNEIATIQGAGQDVPYSTRVSLSLFMGQPLDSTMQPLSIQSSQMALKSKLDQQQGPPQGASKQTSKLGKDVKSYQTPLQASQQRNLTHKQDTPD